MTSSTRRQARVLLALVSMDALVKILAFNLLPADRPIPQCFVCVVLRVNLLNLGSAAQSLIELPLIFLTPRLGGMMQPEVFHGKANLQPGVQA